MFKWDSMAVATLKLLWADGVPTREIARKLGSPCTRNAVVGKADRLSLGEHPWKAAHPSKPRPPTPPKPRLPPFVTYQVAQQYGDDELRDVSKQATQTGAL